MQGSCDEEPPKEVFTGVIINFEIIISREQELKKFVPKLTKFPTGYLSSLRESKVMKIYYDPRYWL